MKINCVVSSTAYAIHFTEMEAAFDNLLLGIEQDEIPTTTSISDFWLFWDTQPQFANALRGPVANEAQ